MTSTTDAPELSPPDERVFTLQPGELLHYDFRTKHDVLDDTVRVLVWNIERGAQLEGIIATLRACQADVIILQELDIYCRRSGYRNVPEMLAQALQAELYFVCEFEEYDSADRPAECAVGPLSAGFHVGMNSHVKPLPDPVLPDFFSRNNTLHSVASSDHDHRSDAVSYNTVGNNSDNSRNNTKKTFPLRHLHGNATLSRRVTLQGATVIAHSVNADWPVLGPKIHEPRCGGRAALRVTLACPGSSSTAISAIEAPPLYIYNCHLEVFCGALTRVRQFGDCMHDAQQLLHQWQSGHSDSKDGNNGHALSSDTAHSGNYRSKRNSNEPAFIIAGDFNTVAHNLARLSRVCGTDRMRLLGLGETEGCWLQRKVLSRNMCTRREKIQSQWQQGMQASRSPSAQLLSLLPRFLWRWYTQVASSDAVWRYCYGFDHTELARLDNTELSFYDPTDKFSSVTLSNPFYYGLVGGKLDWMLCSNLTVQPLLSRHAENSHHKTHGQTETGVRPLVDVAALQSSGSVTDAETIRHLRQITEDDSGDSTSNDSYAKEEANQLHVQAELNKCRDGGFVMFNDYYTDSDHKGMMATLRRHRGCAMNVYPRDRTLYTRSVYAETYLVLTRLLFWSVLCYSVYHLITCAFYQLG